MKHPTRPCGNCPYRKDAPRELWDRQEFVDLLAKDAAFGMDGAVYGCHKGGDLPVADRGWCAGWALDQKKRGAPSIPLRILLMKSDQAVEAWKALDATGLDLFPNIRAMARANGVKVPRTRKAAR